MTTTRKHYAEQFKQDVLAFWASNPTMEIRQICKDFGIHETQFYKWRRQTTEEESVKSSNGTVTLEEHRQAKKRIHELEQENFILKKAAIYFAKDALPKGNTLSS